MGDQSPQKVTEGRGVPGNRNESAATTHPAETTCNSALPEGVLEHAQAANQQPICNIDMVRQANTDLIHLMHEAFADGQTEMNRLRRNMNLTYWLLVGLSISMFLIGAVLTTSPLWSSVSDDSTGLAKMIAKAGLGLVDIFILFMLQPWLHIKKLMADMSQLSFIGDCFQIRVALRLLQSDCQDRTTFGHASDYIREVTKDAVTLIDTYFEKALDNQLAGYERSAEKLRRGNG